MSCDVARFVVKILLTTEGTYPYARGGVSTWVHDLVTGMPEHDFLIGAVVGNPHVSLAYDLPSNTSVLPIPLWGAERIDEYIHGARRARWSGGGAFRRGQERAFRDRLLPAYGEIVTHLLGEGHARGLGIALGDIAEYCETYDLRSAFRDPRCWHLLRDRLAQHGAFCELPMADTVDIARSLYRYLIPLAVPLPHVDIAHSSGAALCALPALAAKFRTGAPFLLTEHGVYVRERVLQMVRDDIPTLHKALLANFYRAVARCAYTYADAVLPVCEYNTAWEQELGVDRDRVHVIYNGVDPARFPAREVTLARPTVAFVGRIEPLKDVLSLITAMGILRDRGQDCVLRIYGPDADRAYAARCRAAVAARGLHNCIRFEGGTQDPAQAYQEADVVTLCSVSEGFPYTVVEAMMSGRPVVATAVGGVPEALGRPDLLVEPQNPRALADALQQQLNKTPEQRWAIGRELRRRAVELFSRDRFLGHYRDLYSESA